MKKKKELFDIIENKDITPVFQPIISLRDGFVHGYEALSRITNLSSIKNTEELFGLADKYKKTWELEKICRKKILKKYAEEIANKQSQKLFINVSPKVMMDESFKANFTKKCLEKRGINSASIVIEITERDSIKNMNEFLQVVDHYNKEGYQIAIDDLGSCYSGLNIISKICPQYLKIDMELVRDIHNISAKYAIVKGVVEMAKNLPTKLIAEGIETIEELKTLIELGVDYGQGFFLGRPDVHLKQLDEEKKRLIIQSSENDYESFEKRV